VSDNEPDSDESGDSEDSDLVAMSTAPAD